MVPIYYELIGDYGTAKIVFCNNLTRDGVLTWVPLLGPSTDIPVTLPKRVYYRHEREKLYNKMHQVYQSHTLQERTQNHES